MQYRKYGSTGKTVSAFGIGIMRFPSEKDQNGNTVYDTDLITRLVRRAVDGGVNYFDSSCIYMEKQSETILGKALAGGYREKVMIATKQPVTEAKTEDDFRKNLLNTMKNLQTDFIDVYFIHNINEENWGKVKAMHMPEHFVKFREEGLIGATGFSYHGGFDTFREVLGYADFDMCQIQQNLLDVDRQTTDKAIAYAESLGKAVVIMEPLRGGGLVVPPAEVKKLFDEFPVKRSSVEWAFRHVYNYPGVSTILSGITTFEQLEDNLRIFEEALPNSMNEDELRLIEQVRAAYEARVTIPCTGCDYCAPCPAGVKISKQFYLNNAAVMLDNARNSRGSYKKQLKAGTSADKCVECGACKPKCPQLIDIPAELKKVHAFLSE